MLTQQTSLKTQLKENEVKVIRTVNQEAVSLQQVSPPKVCTNCSSTGSARLSESENLLNKFANLWVALSKLAKIQVLQRKLTTFRTFEAPSLRKPYTRVMRHQNSLTKASYSLKRSESGKDYPKLNRIGLS